MTTHLLVDGHWVVSNFMVITNNDAINIHLQILM